MTVDQTPTLGWTPTGRTIVAGGALIAIVIGSLSMLVTVSVPPFGGGLFASAIAVLLVSAIARRTLRPHTPRAIRIVWFGAAVKLANMVAIVLLGVTALVAFAINIQYWQTLAGALLFDIVLSFVISLLVAIVANLAAFSTNR